MKDNYSAQIKKAIGATVSQMPCDISDNERQFAEQFFSRLPLAQINDLDPSHACDMIRRAFVFYEQRRVGKSKVSVAESVASEQHDGLPSVVIEVVNDDKPFLVDSLTNLMAELELPVYALFHPLFDVLRDKKGALTALGASNGLRESFIHIEIAALPESLSLAQLEKRIQETLGFIELAVGDWQVVTSKAEEIRSELTAINGYEKAEIAEAQAFLAWLMDHNFVFLGYASVDFAPGKEEKATVDKTSFLGISKEDHIPRRVNTARELLDVRKANRTSPVHRNVLMDVITIKRMDAKGCVNGEHRFYGLFTSATYQQNAELIPYVRLKIKHIIEQAGFESSGHNGKALKAIIQFLPRDELLQIHEDELFDLCMGLLALESRPDVKLFARTDVTRRYISALLFVPRELFSTDVREQVQDILQSKFGATLESFTTQIQDSPLARLHVILRTTEATPDTLDLAAAEQAIATAIMLWSDKLQSALTGAHGAKEAAWLFRRYAHAFPDDYTGRYEIGATLYDITKMEACCESATFQVDLYRRLADPEHVFHLKIYNVEKEIALSDILPLLEHMGCRVIDEFPYVIEPKDAPPVRMRDIRLEMHRELGRSFEEIKPLFENLLLRVWDQTAEDDPLNGLVMHAGLCARQVMLLRALSHYLKQIGFAYSQRAIARALNGHPDITQQLVSLFETRFNPSFKAKKRDGSNIKTVIEEALKEVDALADDRIFRTMTALVMSVLRTNYYMRDGKDERPVLSFKFDSTEVPDLPLPRPFVEIFVFSARVEGIHLRGGKVARGGLRWSDRHEDYRTEVLGLMKAQMVKNAVIVPVGSKGGFVVKQVDSANREAFREEGVACYKLYLSGLLDITDNIVQSKVVPPEQVVRYDEDDPYLVVAADKGTASFSDIANGVSEDYGFWLGDAFASGGSVGYDHKEMGITARGAWVSVVQHFEQMNHDVDTTPFTVAGIGDMSGDVFGNGMLLSEQIKLVAAFNHLHIFLDPNPDPAKSFAERQRLFELPRSNWQDYDATLISKGGGIFDRTAKSIELTPQIRKLLGTHQKKCSPDALMRLILKAPVDLLWNGGIGTYVKAASETDAQVGDRANDTLRINGEELRCKVVGEGGNLGFTQLGRIEYAKTGGRINTDAIDNSAGVDCSDHEVNIKIALKPAVQSGKLTEAKRNTLLASMTDEVAWLVLRDNDLQNKALTIEQVQADQLLESHILVMRTLEGRELLNREIEYLPTEKQLIALRQSGQGLSRPELSVLLAYAKLAIYDDIMQSGLASEPYFASDLARYFPDAMKKKYADEITGHRLNEEIIATVATNSMVNRAGISFYFTAAAFTHLPARDIVAAYTAVRDIFRFRNVWSDIEELSVEIDTEQQVRLHSEVTALLTHQTFWMLRNQPLPLNLEQVIEQCTQAVDQITESLPEWLHAAGVKEWKARSAAYQKHGIPAKLASSVASSHWLSGALDIAHVAQLESKPLEQVARIYFTVSQQLRLDDLRRRSEEIDTPSRWDRQALQSLIFELYDQQRRITASALNCDGGSFECWRGQVEDELARYEQIIDDIRRRNTITTPMLMVALRQLQQVGAHGR